jgi:hypothetical protein
MGSPAQVARRPAAGRGPGSSGRVGLPLPVQASSSGLAVRVRTGFHAACGGTSEAIIGGIVVTKSGEGDAAANSRSTRSPARRERDPFQDVWGSGQWTSG